jgi:hypothetical protein
MATRSASFPRTRETTRPPYDAIVAVCAVLALPLWFVEIHTAFGLPAHPLILHVPVIFVPLLGLAALATAIRPVLMDRYGTALGAFAVVTMAATLLTAGAGEAFADSRQGPPSHLLHEHAEAGQTLRLFVIGLTAALVAWMLGRQRLAAANRGARIPLQLLTAVLALGSIYFVLRAGHLGAELAWAHDH